MYPWEKIETKKGKTGRVLARIVGGDGEGGSFSARTRPQRRSGSAKSSCGKKEVMLQEKGEGDRLSTALGVDAEGNGQTGQRGGLMSLQGGKAYQETTIQQKRSTLGAGQKIIPKQRDSYKIRGEGLPSGRKRGTI